MTHPNLSHSHGPFHAAWLAVALLLPVALLNYLDRQMLASMQSSVMKSIPSIGSQENWGFMLGQFKWVYAALSPIGGYVADRYSRRLTICGSLFVWSAVTWWTGQVETYSELLWARSLMGISEAFYLPAALSLIADHHVGATRSRAVGLHQMAIYCGVIVGGFGGYVAQTPALGWRFAFDVCGVVGMVYALPLALLLRDAPKPGDGLALVQGRIGGITGPTVSEGVRQAQHDVSPSLDVGPGTTPSLTVGPPNVVRATSPLRAACELATNASFVLLVLYFTLPALAGWVVRDWMPSILKKQFAIGEGLAGVSATLYWQLAAIAGAAGGGWLADHWVRLDLRGRVYVSAIGMGLIVPAVLGVGFAGSLSAAVACLVLFGLGWGFFDCNNMPILSQIVRPDLRATGYGVMNLVSISCGGLADWGFGALNDRGVPLRVTFGVFASLALFSVALVLLIRPKADLAEPGARR